MSLIRTQQANPQRLIPIKIRNLTTKTKKKKRIRKRRTTTKTKKVKTKKKKQMRKVAKMKVEILEMGE